MDLRREKKMFLVNGEMAVDLDEISLIMPPNTETRSFTIWMKNGQKIIVLPGKTAIGYWTALTIACTGAELSFDGMDDETFRRLQKISNPFETYGDVNK